MGSFDLEDEEIIDEDNWIFRIASERTNEYYTPKSITPKMLYELAKEKGVENNPIGISYECNDDWYNFTSEEVAETNCFCNDNDMIELFINNLI